MGETKTTGKTVKFPVLMCYDNKGENAGNVDGPHKAEVVIVDKYIKITNTCGCCGPSHVFVEGEFENVSGNDSAIVLKIISKITGAITNHVVFVGMAVGSPFSNIATAKLAYIYF